MKLFKRKPKFIYEISESENLPDSQLYDAYDLVEYITNQDFRFKRDYLKGSVLITKVRNNIHGTVYFAKRIYLPQEEGFEWLKELSDFFTKKPIDYSVDDTEEIKAEDTTEHKETPNGNDGFTLEDFELELHQDTTPVQAEQTSSTDELSMNESAVEERKSVDEAPNEPELVQVSKKEFLSLKQAIEAQKMEIDQLREEREHSASANPEANVSDSKLNPIIPDEVSDLLDKELEIDVSQLEIQSSSDEIVQSVLQSTKAEIDNALAAFVETETKKIKEEIKQLDKRDLIEELVTKRLTAEEQDRLSNLNQQLSLEKEQKTQEEILRHQQALREIEQAFVSQLQEETNVLREAYKNKIDQTIKAEYEKQTDQLSRILQGKMDELKMRQRTMNAGLEANFKEALANFNREHTQVIQVVEQKKHFSPIDLGERRKLKQA